MTPVTRQKIKVSAYRIAALRVERLRRAGTSKSPQRTWMATERLTAHILTKLRAVHPWQFGALHMAGNMQVQEFSVKKVVTTKRELKSLNEWDAFIMYYKLDEQGMRDCPDDEKFVLDPMEASIFNLLPYKEAEKLEQFYTNQLADLTSTGP